jgi:DNA end-binding protein Ku
MTARAMWKGVLRIGDARVPVKLYAAVQDHDIHFRLLDRKDLTPVTQALVDPDTDDVVPYEATQRGYLTPERELVMLHPTELEALTPKESRDIELRRFVPAGAIDSQWYDRPYYLGPDQSAAPYSALTTALARSESEGIASWVMRKKAYFGALRVHAGNLVLISLRRAGEVVTVDSLDLPTGNALDTKELQMAKQLMEMLEDDFDPASYRDAYRDQVLALIESKKQGKRPKLKVVRSRPGTDDLSAALAASLRNRKPKEKARASA